MTFKAQLTADTTAVFFNAAGFADLGTFKKFTSNAITANVPFIVSIGSSDSTQNFGVADVATISIPAAALTVAPERHDTLTAGTVVYTFGERLSADADVYVYAVDTEERHNPK